MAIVGHSIEALHYSALLHCADKKYKQSHALGWEDWQIIEREGRTGSGDLSQFVTRGHHCQEEI